MLATDASPAATFATFGALIAQIAPIAIDPATLRPATTLAGDLMLDSIALISLMALTEERFAITTADHSPEVAALRTVGEAVALVERLRAGQA